MSVVADIEDAVPQVRTARFTLYAIGAVLAAILLGVAFWWLFIHPRHVAERAAQDHADAAVSTGTAGASQDTVRIVVGVDQQHATTDRVTTENDHDIKAAPGAGESVGADLDRAGRNALCMRVAYSTASWCAALRGPGEGVGAVGNDPGSSAAGG